MPILCENKFCIYFERNQCTLHSISLDEIGVCKDSLHVELEEALLEAQRKKQLKKFERLDIGCGLPAKF